MFSELCYESSFWWPREPYQINPEVTEYINLPTLKYPPVIFMLWKLLSKIWEKKIQRIDLRGPQPSSKWFYFFKSAELLRLVPVPDPPTYFLSVLSIDN